MTTARSTGKRSRNSYDQVPDRAARCGGHRRGDDLGWCRRTDIRSQRRIPLQPRGCQCRFACRGHPRHRQQPDGGLDRPGLSAATDRARRRRNRRKAGRGAGEHRDAANDRGRIYREPRRPEAGGLPADGGSGRTLAAAGRPPDPSACDRRLPRLGQARCPAKGRQIESDGFVAAALG